MTNTEALKNLIKSKGLKLGFVARSLGLSSYGFMNKVNNVTDFTTTEVNRLCKLLDVADWSEREYLFFADDVDL